MITPELILSGLPFDANDQQRQLVAALSRFLSATDSDTVFILNGYAGTGKTSVVGALVSAMGASGQRVVLAAPTGRAAKVLESMAGAPAYTIHRLLYRPPAPGAPAVAAVRPNRYPPGTLFIIDEASMIGGGDVLPDLVEYIYSIQGCRAIFVGDTAQLPPVGCDDSPAMQAATYRAMGLRVMRATITATRRQQQGSGILYNATMLRRAMEQTPLPDEPPLRLTGLPDVRVTDSEEFEGDLTAAYSAYGQQGTILITRSNRRARDYNLAIRNRVLGYEERLVRGEQLMIAKNDYVQASRDKRLGFIANGDIARVERVYGTEHVGGLDFAEVCLNFENKGVCIDARILLSTLETDYADVSPQQAAALRTIAGDDPAAMRTNLYYNALHVKYAYAVTCHKAQGGQWDQVFVDMGYIPAEALQSIEFYRWLYTAVTRARRRLTIVM